jgi:hypothetical protein
MFRPTNRRIRLLVGVFLAGLFCIQCTQTQAFRQSKFLVAVNGRAVGQNAPEVADQLERMAKTDHVALLEYCLAHYNASYYDYDVTLIKQERLNGKVAPEQWVDVNFKDDPFSVAMTWTKNPPMGDRVLYVEGAHNNQMLVRPTSPLLRAVSPTAVRPPDGEMAMRSTLRPVSQFGFKRGMESLLEVYRQARKNDECVEQFGGYAEVMGRPAIVLVRYLPNKSQYPASKTVIAIDLDYLVPICIEGYDWNEQETDWSQRLICRYAYTNIHFNVGHTDVDFLANRHDMQEP